MSDNEGLKREISWLTGWVGRELEHVHKLYLYNSALMLFILEKLVHTYS